MSLLNSIFGEISPSNEVSSLFEKREIPSKTSDGAKESVEGDNNDNTAVNKSKEQKRTKKRKGRIMEEPEDKVKDSESNEEGRLEGVSALDGKKDDVLPQTSQVSFVDDNQESEPKATDVAELHDTNKDSNDNDLDERTIFVGNLPNTFTRKSLEKLFRPCGPIESTRIRSLPTLGIPVSQQYAGNQKYVKKVAANLSRLDSDAKPSIVGYVVFQNTDTVPIAISRFNNAWVNDPATTPANEDAATTTTTTTTTTPASTSRRIRVDHTKPQYDSTRSIFVGNLPFRTDEETLRTHFCQGCNLQDDDIQGVRVVRDKDSYQCKGFAYILFKDKAMVATALRNMHGSNYMNKELRVLVCTRRYNSITSGPKKIKKQKETIPAGVAALRRILEKDEKSTKRARGTKKASGKNVVSSGKSRRAVAEAKASKRVKKIQKRISKGMGKTKIG